MKAKNESEKMNNLHGSQAEQLDLLTVLRRGINDVFKVNIWACIFLIPKSLILLVIISGIEVPKWVFFTNATLISIYITCNPIIYLTCYTKLRCFWSHLFRPQRIIPEETNGGEQYEKNNESIL